MLKQPPQVPKARLQSTLCLRNLFLQLPQTMLLQHVASITKGLTCWPNFPAHPSEGGLWEPGFIVFWSELKVGFWNRGTVVIATINGSILFLVLLTLPTNEDLREAWFSSHYGLWQVVLSFLLFSRTAIALTWFNKITTLGKWKITLAWKCWRQ